MKKKVYSLILRYLVIFLVGLSNLWIFYKLFTTPTIFLVSKVLGIFSKVYILQNIIIYKETIIQIIPACVAGAAYYLLFILCLSIPNLKLAKRGLILISSFAILMIINVIRIVFLVLIRSSFYFETVHLIFWYVLSTIFVVLIWILCVRLFSIKEVPVYSDILFLISNLKKKYKKSKSKSKSEKRKKP